MASEIEVLEDTTAASAAAPLAEEAPSSAAAEEALKDDVYTAAAYGDLEKLQRLVEAEGRPVADPDGSGYYALQWAVLNNRVAAAQYILEHGADVNAVDHTGQTALHWSSVRGHVQVAELLLKEGAKVDAADLYGYQATHVAAQYGQTAFIYHIVAKWNADPDVPDNDGRSPLHWAAYKGFADSIRLLLYLDAHRVRQDKEGCTPLHWAAIRGNLDACTVLVQAGKKDDLMPLIKEAVKVVAPCARYKTARGQLQVAVEQATAAKEGVEERAARLEEELNFLRKEVEDRRAEEERVARAREAEEERVAQARDAEATRLRSLASALSGALGRGPPPAESEGSDVLQGAIKAVEDSVELAKAAVEKASGALTALHEGVFPDKEVPKVFDALAGSFDAEGTFLMEFARDNTVCGLETTLMVLLGHGVSIDFDTVMSSIPEYTDEQSEQAIAGARKLQETLEKFAQSKGDAAP